MSAWPYSTVRWQLLRRQKLAEVQWLCEDCTKRGRTVAATDVDHVIEIRHGGDPFPTLDGLSAKCHPCHSIKTMGGNVMKGCDAQGNPIDPGHPFNR